MTQKAISSANLERCSSQHDIPFYEFVSEEGVKNGVVDMTILRDIHATIKFNPSPQGSMSDGGPVYFMAIPIKIGIDGFPEDDIDTVNTLWNGDHKLAICTDFDNYKFPDSVHTTPWTKAIIKGKTI